MGAHGKLLFVVALILAVLTCGVWAWHLNVGGNSRQAAAPPPGVVDDAKERSLEEIEASVAASQAFINGLGNESKEQWKKINWSPTIEAALKTAREVNKPVLVLLSVREIGTQDPGRC
jgi:hypothetical protein